MIQNIPPNSKQSYLDTAKLTGDTLTFEDAGYWNWNGTEYIYALNVIVEGDVDDLNRFVSAHTARCMVNKLDPVKYTLLRVYTDEEIVEKYRKQP